MECHENYFNSLPLIYRENMKNIEKLQRHRTQNRVVIVTDDRYNLDGNMAGFDVNVEFLKLPGMKLGCVFPFILRHPHFGRGTIWVFSGGIHDLIHFYTNEECLQFCCPTPQSMLSLSPSASDTYYLIKTSLQLNLDILQSTRNDIALFSGLIPVRINQYNEVKLRNRSCILIHLAKQILNIYSTYYNKYSYGIVLYNKFVKYHASFLGYSPWDLQLPKFGSQIPLAHQLHINGYSILFGEDQKIADRARLLCYELLATLSLELGARKRAILLSEVHQEIRNANLLKFFAKFGDIERIGKCYAGYSFILFKDESTVTAVLNKGSLFVINKRTFRVSGFGSHSSFSKVQAATSSNKVASNLQSMEDVKENKNEALKACHENSSQLELCLGNVAAGKIEELSTCDKVEASNQNVTTSLLSSEAAKLEVSKLQVLKENQKKTEIAKLGELSLQVKTRLNKSEVVKPEASKLQLKTFQKKSEVAKKKVSKLHVKIFKNNAEVVKPVALKPQGKTSLKVPKMMMPKVSKLQGMKDNENENEVKKYLNETEPEASKIQVIIGQGKNEINVMKPEVSKMQLKRFSKEIEVAQKIVSRRQVIIEQTNVEVVKPVASKQNVSTSLKTIEVVKPEVFKIQVITAEKEAEVMKQPETSKLQWNSCQMQTEVADVVNPVDSKQPAKTSLKSSEVWKPEVSKLQAMNTNQEKIEAAGLEVLSLQVKTGLSKTEMAKSEASKMQLKTETEVVNKLLVVKTNQKEADVTKLKVSSQLEKRDLNKLQRMELIPTTFSMNREDKSDKSEQAVHHTKLSFIDKIQDETPVVPEKTFQYDKVVIIADSRYKPFLSHIKNPQVIIVADTMIDMDISIALRLFEHNYKNHLTGKTLYLLVLGIHTIAKTVPCNTCQRCKVPAESLESLYSLNYFDTFCQNYVRIINCALHEFKLLLPFDSNIAISPPLPISLMNRNQRHEMLHTNKTQYPDYFVASRPSELHQLYPKWMSMILNVAVSSMAKASLKYPYKPGELPKLRKLETMACSDKDKPTYEIWKEILSNVVEAALFKTVSGEASIYNQITMPQPVKLEGNSNIDLQKHKFKRIEKGRPSSGFKGYESRVSVISKSKFPHKNKENICSSNANSERNIKHPISKISLGGLNINSEKEASVTFQKIPSNALLADPITNKNSGKSLKCAASKKVESGNNLLNKVTLVDKNLVHSEKVLKSDQRNITPVPLKEALPKKPIKLIRNSLINILNPELKRIKNNFGTKNISKKKFPNIQNGTCDSQIKSNKNCINPASGPGVTESSVSSQTLASQSPNVKISSFNDLKSQTKSSYDIEGNFVAHLPELNQSSVVSLQTSTSPKTNEADNAPILTKVINDSLSERESTEPSDDGLEFKELESRVVSPKLEVICTNLHIEERSIDLLKTGDNFIDHPVEKCLKEVSIKDNKDTTLSDFHIATSTDNKPNQIESPEFSESFDDLREIYSKPIDSQKPSNKQICSLQDSEVPQKFFQYEKVTIIADCRYNTFLNQFKNSEVVILADEQINIENLEVYLSKNEKNLTSKTLYLLVIGIHSISRTIPLDSCRMIGCSKPLQSLELRTDFDNFDTFCADYVKKINTTLCNVKSYLPNESNFALLPPLPISLINSNLKHHRLHLHMSLCPGYFVANKMSNLQQLYTDWTNTILNLSISSMTKISLACPSRLYELHLYKKHEMIGSSVKDKPTYNIWKDAVAATINGALRKSNAKEVSMPVIDTIPLTLKPSIQLSKVNISSISNSVMQLEKDLNDSSEILKEDPKIIIEDFLVTLDENLPKTLKLTKIKLTEDENLTKSNFRTVNANILSIPQQAKRFDDDNLEDSFILLDSTESNENFCVLGEINSSLPHEGALYSSISKKVSKPVLDKIPLPLKPSLQPSKEKLSSISSSIIPLEIDLNDSSIILEENLIISFEDSLVTLDDNLPNTLKLTKIELTESQNLTKSNVRKVDANIPSIPQQAKRFDEDNLDDSIILLDSAESNEHFCVSGEFNSSVSQSLHKLQEVVIPDYQIFENCKNMELFGMKPENNIDVLKENECGYYSTLYVQESFKNETLIDVNLTDQSLMKPRMNNYTKQDDQKLNECLSDLESSKSNDDDFKDFCRINSLPYNGILLSPIKKQGIYCKNNESPSRKNESIYLCSSPVDELFEVQNNSISKGSDNLFNLSLLKTDNDHSICKENSTLPDLSTLSPCFKACSLERDLKSKSNSFVIRERSRSRSFERNSSQSIERTVRSRSNSLASTVTFRSHSCDRNLTSEANSFDLREMRQQRSRERYVKSISGEKKAESRSNSSDRSDRSSSRSIEENIKFKVITKMNIDGTKSMFLEGTVMPQVRPGSKRSRSNSHSSNDSHRSRSSVEEVNYHSTLSGISEKSKSPYLERNKKSRPYLITNGEGSLEKYTKSRPCSRGNRARSRSQSPESNFRTRKRSRMQSPGRKKKFKSNFSSKSQQIVSKKTLLDKNILSKHKKESTLKSHFLMNNVESKRNSNMSCEVKKISMPKSSSSKRKNKLSSKQMGNKRSLSLPIEGDSIFSNSSSKRACGPIHDKKLYSTSVANKDISKPLALEDDGKVIKKIENFKCRQNSNINDEMLSKASSLECNVGTCSQALDSKISKLRFSRSKLKSLSKKKNVLLSSKYRKTLLNPKIGNAILRTEKNLNWDFKAKSIFRENLSKSQIINFFSKSSRSISNTNSKNDTSPSYSAPNKMCKAKLIENYCKSSRKYENPPKTAHLTSTERFTLEQTTKHTPKRKHRSNLSNPRVLEYLDEDSQQCSKVSSSSEERIPFVFEDALSLIESLCDQLVFLGPAIKKMIAVAKDLGTATKEAYSVFTIPENVVLVNLMLTKFEAFSKSSSNDAHLFEKAVIIIPKLLEEAKNGPRPLSHFKDFPIDVEEIARLSFGKGTDFVLAKIISSLADEGISNPDKNVINELFKEVNEVLFNLIIQKVNLPNEAI